MLPEIRGNVPWVILLRTGSPGGKDERVSKRRKVAVNIAKEAKANLPVDI